MNTVADMFAHIDRLVNREIRSMSTELRAAYRLRRAETLAATRRLWDAASIMPQMSSEVGNVVYVSRAEANKYGRLNSLNNLIRDQHRTAALFDVSQLERRGVKLYETGYNGYAWTYNQGYGLPVTAGARVRLVADSVYSDFYGKNIISRVHDSLGESSARIIGDVTRGLNQGQSYRAMAETISANYNREYNNALRIARTEGGRMYSQATLDTEALLDSVGAAHGKMWIKTPIGSGGDRQDHFAMSGEMADDNGIFHLPSGATGPAPRLTGEPSEDINCACSHVIIINGERPENVRVRGRDIMPFDDYIKELEPIRLSALRRYAP